MIEEPHSSRKQSAGTSQTLLAEAAIGQSSLGSYDAQQLALTTTIYYYKTNLLNVLFLLDNETVLCQI